MMLALAAACSGRPTLASGTVVGAVGPREAVEAFLGTVKKKDIDAMALVWGTAKGPVREQMDRNELEKRELLLICHLQHDGYKVVDQNPDVGGTVVVKVELTLGTLKRLKPFTTIKGPNERWFMTDVDIQDMQPFCKGR
ncbi:MAG: hypothetical protein HY275_04025 [Gemmatimonadetes bacterium]|nr:hypothetical protein [Gemmatimonadota bacterium]